MSKLIEINLGDTVYSYCASSPYTIFSGKVVEILKEEILKRGTKKETRVMRCVIAHGKNNFCTSEVLHPFLSEEEAARFVLNDQRNRKAYLLQQVQNCDESIAIMEEILKKGAKK